MRDFNNHHVFFEKCAWRKSGSAARRLMHLTTVVVPIHEVHREIHASVRPLDVPGIDLVNEMLQAARSVQERGIDRFDAVLGHLARLGAGGNVDAVEYHGLLMRQREIMAVHYPLEVVDEVSNP